MAPEQRGPFSGGARKLVMAFDVGTTYSGVSYALLDPGIVPEIHGVTRYTPFSGFLRVVFSNPIATQDDFMEEAEDMEYVRVEWYALATTTTAMSGVNSRSLY